MPRGTRGKTGCEEKRWCQSLLSINGRDPSPSARDYKRTGRWKRAEYKQVAHTTLIRRLSWCMDVPFAFVARTSVSASIACEMHPTLLLVKGRKPFPLEPWNEPLQQRSRVLATINHCFTDVARRKCCNPRVWPTTNQRSRTLPYFRP